MKLPRWLVIAMLTSSALAVLASAGWWWVTWPKRTAREFVERCVEGDWNKVNAMFAPPEIGDGWGSLPYAIYFDPERPFAEFSAKSRSLPDVAMGKSSFADPHGFGVIVERGQVMSAGMLFMEE